MKLFEAAIYDMAEVLDRVSYFERGEIAKCARNIEVSLYGLRKPVLRGDGGNFYFSDEADFFRHRCVIDLPNQRMYREDSDWEFMPSGWNVVDPLASQIGILEKRIKAPLTTEQFMGAYMTTVFRQAKNHSPRSWMLNLGAGTKIV